MNPIRPSLLASLSPLMLLSIACSDVDPTVAPSMGTLERDRIELSAEVAEPIVEIVVREGDQVETGDLLVRLDSARLDLAIARQRAKLEEADAALRLAVRGPRSESILEGRSRLAAAEAAVLMAKSQLERYQVLVEREVETESKLDNRQGAYDEALARRDEARSALEALLEGTTLEELDQARSVVAVVRSEIDQLELDVARLEVRAPVSGHIDSLPFELGERPPPGAPLVVLLADQPPFARVHVPAQVRVALREEAKAAVRVDGSEEVWEGRLRWISNDAAFTPYFALTQHDRSRLSYLAEVDLVDSRARDLPTGVPTEVTFETSGRPQ